MPAWLLLPADLLCISLFTQDFNRSHSNNTGDSGLIYSCRCCNYMVMPPNESHLIGHPDNGDTVHCYRLDYSSRLSVGQLCKKKKCPGSSGLYGVFFFIFPPRIVTQPQGQKNVHKTMKAFINKDINASPSVN